MIDVDAIRQRFSAVGRFLDERGRRVVAAAEASAAGYGGIAAVSVATGIAASTIGRGLRELSEPRELDRVRRAGGDRKTNVAKDATLLSDLGALCPQPPPPLPRPRAGRARRETAIPPKSAAGLPQRQSFTHDMVFSPA